MNITKIARKLNKIINPKKPTIAIIRLNGVIGKVGYSSGLSLEAIKHVERVKKIKNLKAIALLINSPGGSPVQSELIAKKISNLAEPKNKKGKRIPIYSFCEDVAASGGYWLACIGDEIYASNSSIIGSIGVISQGFGFTEAIKKLGIERRVYTQGKNKSVLDPFSDTKEEDLEIIKDIQKDIHESFIDYVKTRRIKKLKNSDDVFTGKFWSGKQAKSLGLIDDIGYYEEVLKDKFGKKIEFKIISAKQGFLQRKFSSAINSAIDIFSIRFREILHEEKYKL